MSEFPASFFGPGGGFSRLKTFVISQTPTTSITFHSANTSLVQSDFQEQASVEVDLFGVIPVGSGSESYQVQSVDASSSDGSITVTPGAAGHRPFGESHRLRARRRRLLPAG